MWQVGGTNGLDAKRLRLTICRDAQLDVLAQRHLRELATITIHSRAAHVSVAGVLGCDFQAHAVDRGDAIAFDKAGFLCGAIGGNADDEHAKRVATTTSRAEAQAKHWAVVELSTNRTSTARQIFHRDRFHFHGLRLPASPDAKLDVVSGLHLFQLANEAAIRRRPPCRLRPHRMAESRRLTPLIETRRFPSSMPALSAGPPAVTLETRSPSVSRIPPELVVMPIAARSRSSERLS